MPKSAMADVVPLLIVGVVGFVVYKLYVGSTNANMGGTDFGTGSTPGGADSWGADTGSAPTDPNFASNVFTLIDSL